MMKEIVLASHNAGKLQEFEALLSPMGIAVQSAGALGVAEPEETGVTFAENARLKAVHCAEACGLASLSDDSGLVIPALGGAPGIYSARWAGPGKDFSVAFARIERELKEAGAPLDSPAYFTCVLSLCEPGGKCTDFEGRVYGTLTFPPRGATGFGYDPIFIPDGYDVTFAELEAKIKNTISHRANAFLSFVEYLKAV